MKTVATILDSVHSLAKTTEKATRRKKRIRREHLIGAFHLACVIANGIASVVPKAVPVAVVLNGLNNIPATSSEKIDAADSKRD